MMASSCSTPQIPQDVLASLLSASSSKPRPASRVYPSDSSDQVAALTRPDGRNASHLYCPRDGCGCLILRAGDATLAEGERNVYDTAGPFLPVPTSTPTSSSPATQPYWKVLGSPMTFENVGFSRNVQRREGEEKATKFLICADCDMGPLGWSVEGSQEAWVGVERVRYAA